MRMIISFFLSEGYSVALVGKFENSILIPNQTWISVFIGRYEGFGSGISTHDTETDIPLEVNIEK